MYCKLYSVTSSWEWFSMTLTDSHTGKPFFSWPAKADAYVLRGSWIKYQHEAMCHTHTMSLSASLRSLLSVKFFQVSGSQLQEITQQLLMVRYDTDSKPESFSLKIWPIWSDKFLHSLWSCPYALVEEPMWKVRGTCRAWKMSRIRDPFSPRRITTVQICYGPTHNLLWLVYVFALRLHSNTTLFTLLLKLSWEGSGLGYSQWTWSKAQILIFCYVTVWIP